MSRRSVDDLDQLPRRVIFSPVIIKPRFVDPLEELTARVILNQIRKNVAVPRIIRVYSITNPRAYCIHISEGLGSMNLELKGICALQCLSPHLKRVLMELRIAWTIEILIEHLLEHFPKYVRDSHECMRLLWGEMSNLLKRTKLDFISPFSIEIRDGKLFPWALGGISVSQTQEDPSDKFNTPRFLFGTSHNKRLGILFEYLDFIDNW